MSEQKNDELEVQPNPVLHLIAPFTAIAATMVLRKVLTSAYARKTGGDAPDPRDPGVPLGRALVWAVGIAATAAAVEVVVFRVMNRGAK
ncbi:MAG: DUF4235 domain-containing protein [Actinomycetota bacterium]|nr:DUF4235 domain-containing protein [Actinomycetota bacterium]